mmetsp:Transcript_6541/g.19842  ORF Transcript_6541/g.19842 Transcript_6541/m.19842 type:complete len:233 (+) Transcript_6541:218-916(+)
MYHWNGRASSLVVRGDAVCVVWLPHGGPLCGELLNVLDLPHPNLYLRSVLVRLQASAGENLLCSPRQATSRLSAHRLAVLFCRLRYRKYAAPRASKAHPCLVYVLPPEGERERERERTSRLSASQHPAASQALSGALHWTSRSLMVAAISTHGCCTKWTVSATLILGACTAHGRNVPGASADTRPKPSRRPCLRHHRWQQHERNPGFASQVGVSGVAGAGTAAGESLPEQML